MKISCVYKIQSIIKPERFYIGSACNFERRRREHRNDLRRGIHCNPKLQNHFNKYGESDLKFSVLLGCDESELINNEQFFIDSYNPWFNVRILAHSNLGIKYSEESKKRMSEAQKKCVHSPERLEQFAKINIGRKLSEEHKSKLATARLNMTDEQKQRRIENVIKALKARIGIKATPEAREKMRLAHLGIKTGRRNIDYEALVQQKKIPVLQYDLEMNFIREWPSSRDAEKELGINHKNISSCANGRYKTAHGFIWKHKDWELNIN